MGKRFALSAMAGGLGLALAGCYAYEPGYYGPAYPYGVAYYDGYYDGYYGPYTEGYWGPDAYFYFRGRGGRFFRDEGRHFRRDSAPGFHEFHTRGPAERGEHRR